MSVNRFIGIMSDYGLLKILAHALSTNAVPLKVNVWCGLTHDKMLGQFFFEGHTDGKQLP